MSFVSRCKVQLQEVKEFCYSEGKEFTFRGSYDPSIPEDKRFQEASPSIEFKITVNNPTVLAEWKNGESFYCDFHRVPKAD